MRPLATGRPAKRLLNIWRIGTHIRGDNVQASACRSHRRHRHRRISIDHAAVGRKPAAGLTGAVSRADRLRPGQRHPDVQGALVAPCPSHGSNAARIFIFGGTSSPSSQVDWCGAELNWRCLAYGRGSTEVDFVVPEDSCHVVALVPQDLLIEYLGEESATALLGNGHFLQCEPRLSQQLLAMITRFADKFSAHPELLNDERVCRAVEWQLLGSLAEVLFARSAGKGSSSMRRRYRALRHAVRFVESKHQPLSVPELAAAAGVSQRVLELAFQETLEVSPRRYLLWNRLNGLQQDLRKARAELSSVTEIATHWGFGEFGRTAVYYKELLGESPLCHPGTRSSTSKQAAGGRLARIIRSGWHRARGPRHLNVRSSQCRSN